MTISKLDKVKSILQLPLICPCCSKPMKKKILDKKMYFIHKMCFDCVIDEDTKLIREGKYEEHAKNIINQNIKSYIEDLKGMFQEFILDDNIVNDFVTEAGDIYRSRLFK